MTHIVKRLVRAGKFVAEVTIESLPDDDAWGPYVSLADALKLERVEVALKAGDLKAAAREARVYEMTPVMAAE